MKRKIKMAVQAPSFRPTVAGNHYAVATGHYLATAAAMRILDGGGNAVDAGVTAAMALPMLQPDMVGAVGTQASYGAKAKELEVGLMKRLGLGVADINWQPARDRFAEYVCVLGLIGATLGKIANQIYVLEHNEIDELLEPFSEGKVGSSTMKSHRLPPPARSR